MNQIRQGTRGFRPFAFLAVGLVLIGCQQAPEGGGVAAEPIALESPDAVAACLPAGITLETKTTDKEGDTSETVKDTLARLKAQVKNGKLYDISKHEIHFYTPTGKGLEILREKAYKDLIKKKYTVVMIAGA